MVCQLRAIFYFFWISHASPVPRLRRISLEIFEQKTHSCRALQARFNLADWLILAQNYSNAILLGCWEVLTSQVSQAQIPNCTPGNTVGTYLYILFRLCDIDAGGCHAVGVARCLVSESHLVSTWMTPFLWCAKFHIEIPSSSCLGAISIQSREKIFPFGDLLSTVKNANWGESS